MSTVSAIEKSGAVALDSAMRRETVCWSRVSSSTSTSPLGPASAFCGSFLAGSSFLPLAFSSSSFFSALSSLAAFSSLALSAFLAFLSFFSFAGASAFAPSPAGSSATSASPFSGASLVAPPPFSAAA